MPYLTSHGELRLAQRGFRELHIPLMMLFGSETTDGYMMTSQDAARALQGLRLMIKHVERLEGARFVMAGDVLVTAYWPTKLKAKRLHQARKQGHRTWGARG